MHVMLGWLRRVKIILCFHLGSIFVTNISVINMVIEVTLESVKRKLMQQ